ncbi:hypothetical protein LCGC14_1944300 [marine sediment metagenome]|uniref:Uncharacterized protein n=1 Tax=marine sediment metagenome TaxID=412755 RepID=A0A0F9HXL7_9ZZZZ
MAGRLPRVTGATGVVDTADLGYFFGYTVTDSVTTAGTVFVSTNNQVRAFLFVLPFREIVRRITITITNSIASSLVGVGIYDKDGNRLLHSGAIDSSSAAVISTTITAVTLEPGVYYFAQTTNDTTVQARIWSAVNVTGPILNEGTLKLVGSAANSSSSGVLPATLGTITAATTRNPMVAVFQP